MEDETDKVRINYAGLCVTTEMLKFPVIPNLRLMLMTKDTTHAIHIHTKDLSTVY